MISFQKCFLFVHIPKTAGNSIQSILCDYSEDQLIALRKEQDGIERFGLRNPKYKIKKHSTLSEYHDALGDEQFRNLYKFTCVRNPWDRMVSYYFTPTQNPETWNRKKFRGIISKAVSVADYLRVDNGEEDIFLRSQAEPRRKVAALHGNVGAQHARQGRVEALALEN